MSAFEMPLTGGASLRIERSSSAVFFFVYLHGADDLVLAHTMESVTDCALIRTSQDSMAFGSLLIPLPAGGFDKLREAFPDLAVKDYREVAA